MKLNRKKMLETLEHIVNIDSGSYDKDGVDKFGKFLIKKYDAIGFNHDVYKNELVGNHIVLRHHSAKRPKIIILAHLDTVFKEGTARKRPFSIKGNRAYGPGVIDMKASHIMLLYAMKKLVQGNHRVLKDVEIVFNSDEEIGSRQSRKLIEKLSKDKSYALVLEPARSDGSIVSARRGSGKFEFNVTGRAAHSGLNPDSGVNATKELAYKIIEIEQLSDPDEDLHVSVVQIEGGEASNIIPETAHATIDVRISTEEQGAHIEHELKRIASNPRLDGTTIEVYGEFTRPPMEHTEEIEHAVRLIKSEARSLKIDLEDTSTGGGSDASFPAAQGVVTIDGLGPIGGEQHSKDEYLEIDSLFERTELFINILKRLEKDLRV